MTLQVRGIIVVLGSPNSEAGELSSIAKERCELALAEYGKHPDWKFLLTGGYGAHFNTTDQPHAAYVKRHLVSRGIPGQEILELVESTNTLQDASLSKPIIMKYRIPEIVVVTSDYHVARARYVFEREFADTEVRISFSASQTDEAACGFDLDAQKKHEQQALAKLKEQDKRAWYKLPTRLTKGTSDPNPSFPNTRVLVTYGKTAGLKYIQFQDQEGLVAY